MNRPLLFILAIFFSMTGILAQVGINSDNNTPDPSAGLDVKFNNKGFLPPRMTHIELNAIANPADGLMVYCTDCGAGGTGALSMVISGKWTTFSPNCLNPVSPVSGTHISFPTQIVWNWYPVTDATGYKWNTTMTFPRQSTWEQQLLKLRPV